MFFGNKNLTALGLVFIIAGSRLLPANAQAVGTIPNLGIEISPTVIYDQSTGAYHSQLMYARVASPKQIDPNARGTGTIQTLFFSAGTRTTNFETFDFRWRAGLIAMDLIRTPLSMGVSLVDYNESGLLDTDIKWINLRLGPSVFIGNDRTHLAIRAIGVGGITTLKLGSFSYTGLGSSQELRTRKRSYEVGYLGETRILFANRVSIIGSFQYRNQLGGLRPNIYQATGKLGFRLTPIASLQGICMIEETHVGRSSETRYIYGGLLSLVF